jgi:hypothetical protein
LLQFQTDLDGAGLSIPDGRKVFTPSLDPEVIYHEVAHACMWILNPSPFEQNNVNVPFWRALTEGYADYFARSFAARRETAAVANANPTQRWAAAAFRAFGDERALARGMNNPHDGQDRLGIANLYPEDQVEAAGTYRVGMIWARALWDIRQFFAVPRNQNAQAPCARSFSARGIADVDRWALHAYMHMAGFVCNFEAAAEAFISEAQRTGQATACEIEHIKSIFLARGIFAERGMQALAAQGNVIAVGADAGVRRFVSNPPSWANPALQDVVALAANQTAANAVTLYAATETGVFKHDNFPNGQWSNLGQWIVGETPICMLFEQNLLFVGTAHGLYSCDPANPQWRAWNPPPGARVPFLGVTFNMTCGELRDAAGLSYRACFVADLSAPLPRPGNGVKLNIMTQNPPLGSAAGTQGALRPLQDLNGWVNLEVIPNVTRTENGETRVMSGRPTAVALGVIPSNVPGASPSTNLYVGTLGRGVWRLQGILHERNSGLVNQTLTAMPNNIPEGIAVLCLVCDTLGGRNRLLAGTNVGVFEHPIALPNSGWTRLAGLPANAMVRQIAVTAGQPLCVTFNQGLLFHNGVNWQSLSF